MLLERDGYHDLKTTEVTRRAGVAAGVFYNYFKTKDELVLALLDELFEENAERIFDGPHVEDAFEAVLAANRRYVNLFAGASGLNRAVGQIVDALPLARQRWLDMNGRIAKRIAAGVARRAADAQPTVDPIFAAVALQAMLDAVLLQAFVYKDPSLADMARNPERLAHELSVLWFRASYGRHPETKE